MRFSTSNYLCYLVTPYGCCYDVFCMKDYYQILEITEDASEEDIKKSFRRLAFLYHPDRNPGNEVASGEHFKKINEAYTVLCDRTRRLKYDKYRRSEFSQSGSSDNHSYQRSYVYTFDEEFFSSEMAAEVFTDLERMFSQMGLRFDKGFFNSMFSQKGEWQSPSHFRYSYRGMGGIRQDYSRSANVSFRDRNRQKQNRQLTIRQPGIAARLTNIALSKISIYALKKAFGIDLNQAQIGEDIHQKLVINSAEARDGCTKRIKYKRGKEKKTIEVRVPKMITTGKKIKLSGMGQPGVNPGDLYLHVTVK